jgi:hypothetical protein
LWECIENSSCLPNPHLFHEHASTWRVMVQQFQSQKKKIELFF